MRLSQTCFRPDPGQVYQPAEDSFLLLRAAEREVSGEDRVLEVGAGTGYVAARLSCRMVLGTDINPHAVRIAREKGVEMVRTDLAACFKSGSFDLIIFNPPYLPTKPEDRIHDWLEYALDGGTGGLDSIARFLKEVPGLLTSRGRVLLLVSSLNKRIDLKSLIHDSGWDCTVVDREILEDGEVLCICRLSLVPVLH